MEKVVSELTVLYSEPFWIVVYERRWRGMYEVCKVTFGAEPKDYEVYDFFIKNWSRLEFSTPMPTASVLEKRINPKRMQRVIGKRISDTGIGTKAQQALQNQREQLKLKRKTISREKREAEKERKFRQRTEKKKEKHRGH